MSYDNIPLEMRGYNQWIVWRYEETDGEKPTKVPYCPATGYMASVTNPQHWGSFELAVAAASDPALGWSGIGFVLTRDDPYTIIDLDDTKGNADFLAKQRYIFEAFDSYSELSPSRTGLHIVIRASIGAGRRRDKVELYSQERYMTFTGDRYGKHVEIFERQELASQLWHEMGKNGADVLYDGNAPQTMEDNAVLDAAARAANGEKFWKLHVGDWQSLYASQSEADFAYVDILAFYTQNREQLHRMFLASPLGARDKAQRQAYRDYMINKSFDRMLPAINFDSITNAIKDAIEERRQREEAGQAPVPPKPLDEVRFSMTPPPGLLGDIARFLYEAAPRPVPEIAMAGAIGLLAGIVGRSYNVSATGLNQYVLLLANTGTGKEAISSGISRLLGPMIRWDGVSDTETPPSFAPIAAKVVGPSDMASGQGLLNNLSKRERPCYVSLIGEFGLRFKSMADPRANPADVSLLRTLLDLYNKSGAGNVLGETVYSDKDKNTKAIIAPNVSLIGESVPSSFYGYLSEEMIANGLLPRFTIIEYTGPRPRRNPIAADVKPSPHLLALMQGLMANVAAIGNGVVDVAMQPDAQTYLDDFDVYCDDQINASGRQVTKELWNRAHVKALKLAALIAVGVEWRTPTITLEHATWARQQIETDIRHLLFRFESGDFGVVSKATDHDRQTAYVLQKIWHYTTCEYDAVQKYQIQRDLHGAHIVPYQFLSRTCLSVAAFKADKDATRALKRSIQNLVDEGTISRVQAAELLPFKHRGEAYVITNANAASASV